MSEDIQDEAMVVIAVFGSSGDVRQNSLCLEQWLEPGCSGGIMDTGRDLIDGQ